ncbi:hypothetical protein Q3G72_010427 [Acer saccharum]|nr:hypothetical protein Q3G72_010427 [Acer saccharum]
MVLKIMLRYWIFAFLGGLALSTVLLVQAHQTGFISIDCGTPKDFEYTERTTGITYISDAIFTDTGVVYNIASGYNSDNLEQPFWTVRSFPEGSRNCYSLKPARGNTEKFFIRASFMYGNYGGQNQLPRFGLLLEADEWDSESSNVSRRRNHDMENLKLLIFSFLGILALTVLIHAQTQSGFISVDCGLPENSAYTDKKTGINYTSDVTFTETGVSYNISTEYNRDTLEQPFLTVRSFPEGTKNCYTLKPLQDIASFLLEQVSLELSDASTIVSKEIIHVPPTNYVDICLGNKGSGTPFISSLELRPLVNSSYLSNLGTSLLLYSRLDVGSTAEDNETYRQVVLFKDDAYDRIWSAYTRSNWVTISSLFKIVRSTVTNNQPPSAVMQTAAMPANGSNSLKEMGAARSVSRESKRFLFPSLHASVWQLVYVNTVTGLFSPWMEVYYRGLLLRPPLPFPWSFSPSSCIIYFMDPQNKKGRYHLE